MRFDRHEWVKDMVTRTIAGMASGAAGAMFVPDPPFLSAMAAGGVVALVTGILALPIRWLLSRGPGSASQPERKESQS
jgi:hypothetical protein